MSKLKDYRPVADDARDYCETAKAQSRQHSCDLKQMKRLAADATELLRRG